jgi:hypothetical protein
MKPVSSNIDKYASKSGCMPISASCIVWNGPDIPCIQLCSGDTIDVVIYELAKILCDITENVLNISTLDFGCILQRGDCPPTTLLETLQLMINYACTPVDPITPEPTPLPNVQLPECLWYVNETGDTVTALPLVEYVEYLASMICQIVADINSIYAIIDTLNIRITILENTIGGGGTPTPITTIVTQCLSGATPGLTIPISTAFQTLEQKLCEYLAVLGTLTQWQSMFNTICITATTPLPCGEGTYGDLPGWIDSVTTVADSMSNLWLVVCQLNSCTTGVPAALPCVLIPPVSAVLGIATTTSCFVTWVAPVTTGVQAPLGYKIEVFALPGTGPAISSTTVGPTPLTFQILSASITPDTEYIVKVTALYECGESTAATVQGVLQVAAVAANLFFTELVGAAIPAVCNAEPPYDSFTNTLRVDLKDASGNPLVNTGTSIEITYRLDVFNSCGNTATTEDVTIIIATGTMFGTIDYAKYSEAFCDKTLGCLGIRKSLKCFVSAQLVGGGTLPVLIGLDPSITAMGIC